MRRPLPLDILKIRKLVLGALYTPPTFQGTLMRPGLIGGANWGGGAFNVETGILYVKTSNLPHVARLARPDRPASDPRAAEVDAIMSPTLDPHRATLSGSANAT